MAKIKRKFYLPSGKEVTVREVTPEMVEIAVAKHARNGGNYYIHYIAKKVVRVDGKKLTTTMIGDELSVLEVRDIFEAVENLAKDTMVEAQAAAEDAAVETTTPTSIQKILDKYAKSKGAEDLADLMYVKIREAGTEEDAADDIADIIEELAELVKKRTIKKIKSKTNK